MSSFEIYECDTCYFRVKTLSAIRTHMEELHSDENKKIIHLKLDRKDEHLVSVTEHLRHELFEKENNWAKPNSRNINLNHKLTTEVLLPH